MKSKSPIHVKAMILLAVFSLNTVVGFACSIGMDLGYNKNHHQESVTEPDKDGHSHCSGHVQEPVKKASHQHADGKAHDHHSEMQKTEPGNSDLPNDDDCCTNEVLKFNNLDKNISSQKTGFKFQPKSIVFGYDLYTSKLDIAKVPLLHSSRYLFPPPPDILASIQKFQI